MQAIFAEVQIIKGKTETSKDDNGTMVIGGAKQVTMSDETLQKVIAATQEVRAKYIQ
jgi:hypothetical protein